jgi:hypothetical protein
MVRWLLLVALVGCHHHREPNAPGVIDPLAPPKNLGTQEPEYPGDPGETMVMLTYGLLGGPGITTGDDEGFVDLDPEITLSWGQSDRTHNDAESKLFIPRSVVLPPKSYGISVGWSALRFTKDINNQVDATTGPIYVEAQRAWILAGFGGGIAIDPRSGAIGPQVQGFYTFYFLRSRYLFGDGGGFEFSGGFQLKIPTTWVTRRRS